MDGELVSKQVHVDRNVGVGAYRSTLRKPATTVTGLVAACMLVACNGVDLVPVPSPQTDQAPVINLSNFSVGGSAVVDKPEVSSSGGPTVTVTVGPSGTPCEIPTLAILASAKNPAGGVKEFTLHIRLGQSGTTLYDVTATATQNSSGQVPVTLSILGHNNAGGPGGEALQLAFDGGKLGCPTSGTFTVAANAKNFNDQTTTLTETINAQLSSAGCICE